MKSDIIHGTFAEGLQFDSGWSLMPNDPEGLPEDVWTPRRRARAAADKVEPWIGTLERTFREGVEHGTVMTVGTLRKIKRNFGDHQFTALKVDPTEVGVGEEAWTPGSKVFNALAAYNGRVRLFERLALALGQLDLRGQSAHVPVAGWEWGTKWVKQGEEAVPLLALFFQYRGEVRADWSGVPVFMFDATARQELAELVAPDVHIERHEARADHMKVYAHPVKSAKKDWPSRVDIIDAWARRRAAGGDAASVGVIVHKPVAQALEAKYADAGGTPYKVLWFGAHKGRNSMKACRTIGIFGRPLASQNMVAAAATTLRGVPARPGDRITAPAFWRLADGGLIEASRYCWPAGLQDALGSSVVYDALVQAVGRGRGVRRTASDPLVVHLFVDCCVQDVLVDGVSEPADFDVAAGWQGDVLHWWGLGVHPIGYSGRFWADVLGISLGAWSDRRKTAALAAEGTVASWLDADEATAKALANAGALAVAEVDTAGGKVKLVLTAPSGADALRAAGYTVSVLSGKARSNALA